MRILILDDDLNRHTHFKKNLIGHELICVETAQECIDQIKNNVNFDYIFLDHDLGGHQMVESGKNTGYEVAFWLSNNLNKLSKNIIVHSLNPVGSKNMINILPHAKYIPGVWLKIVI